MKTSQMFAVAAALTGLIATVSNAKADPDARRSPPQEAFTACASAKTGDACSVTFHDRAHEGTCAAFGDQGLACRPKPPQAAVDACASSSQGAACTVTFGDKTMAGTCEAPPDGTLACRPAKRPSSN